MGKTYVEPDVFREIVGDLNIYAIEFTAENSLMDGANEFIDGMREIHKRYKFKCHTCECCLSDTRWGFAYDYEMGEQPDELFEEAMVVYSKMLSKYSPKQEAVKSNGTCVLRKDNIHSKCVCPFDMS